MYIIINSYIIRYTYTTSMIPLMSFSKADARPSSTTMNFLVTQPLLDRARDMRYYTRKVKDDFSMAIEKYSGSDKTWFVDNYLFKFSFIYFNFFKIKQ